MTAFIESLGECRYLSPLGRAGPGVVKFKTDRDQILCDDRANDGLETARVSQLARAFEIAGPRERIYFDSFVHIPLKLVTQSRRKIDPEGDVWRFVLEATGQPA